MTKRGLIKSTGVIGFATSISRVLGFVRDIVIARFFGTQIYAQAFVVAFRIPNLLRDLIGEGATNAALVPVLTDELTRKGRADFFKLARVLFNILFWMLVALTVLGVAISPFIIRVIAPGFVADAEKFRITVTLTRVLMPFLALVGLWAYAMGVLNTLGKFAAPAFGPCVLNLSIILCASRFGENVFGLTTGVLIGGALQLAMQFPSLYMSGWRFKMTREFIHPKAKKAGLLLVPRALGACIYQFNVFVGTILASLSSVAGEGAVAALYYANRVWQLPLGIFGIALAQAALPAMSRHVALNDSVRLKDMLSFSMRILLFVLIPSSVGLMVLSAPITKVLFQRGAFTGYSTAITSHALFFYSFGLAACGGVRILANAFYSMHDTMMPVKAALVAAVINLALNLTLMWPLKLGGLALATSVSAVVNFIILFVVLKRRIGDFGAGTIIDSFFRVVAASLVMAAVLFVALKYIGAESALTLALLIFTGIAVYLSAGYIFRIRELRDFLSWIIRKR